MSNGSITRRLSQRLRWLGLRSYYRLVRWNYDHKLVASRKRTHGGTIRSYDLYNRHGTDEMLEELVEYCGPTDVIYDIGAHVGVYAMALTVDHPDRYVVAFEPSPIVATQFQTNIQVNDLDGQIDLSPSGLGDETGPQPFYMSTYPELSGFDRESATRWEASIAEVVSVPVDQLDDVVNAGPTPDILKIDVEGTGPAVLRGGKRTLTRDQPVVFLEFHEDGLDGSEPRACRELLEDCGYAICKREEYWVGEPIEHDV